MARSWLMESPFWLGVNHEIAWPPMYLRQRASASCGGRSTHRFRNTLQTPPPDRSTGASPPTASTDSSPDRRGTRRTNGVTASVPELRYRWPIGASSLHSIVRQMVSLAPVCCCRGALPLGRILPTVLGR